MPRNASTTSNAGIEVYEYDTGSRLTRVTLDGVETQRFEYDENGVKRIVRDELDQRLHYGWTARPSPSQYSLCGTSRRPVPRSSARPW